MVDLQHSYAAPRPPAPRSDDDNDAVLFEKIKRGTYDADDPIWEGISDDAKDIVARLLTVDAVKRLTAQQALDHPWVQGQCFGSATEGACGRGREGAEGRASGAGPGLWVRKEGRGQGGELLVQGQGVAYMKTGERAPGAGPVLQVYQGGGWLVVSFV